FQSQTTIKYYLPKQSNVTLKVLDFLGREIRSLAQNKKQTAGWHEQQFQVANNAAGTYFLVLTNGEQQKMEKIVLIK
ncbi:MAG: T9SS type A sorting domain-containing protein, partial [Saprospiraceae bacterium]